MSSIYKLSISGIRSFSDETQETIQFGKPLTLIVGTNGSGKTTIIECLRYATTNELPPNTKNGASFINDPNLHSSNETKAQIKLAFQDTKKVNLILSKSLMASKNPRTKTISFKTKENQLMAIHHGEKQTLSSKVADIENLIPHHLGVSKAILNYVIFCHQDESLWPISESAILKKKFDEIFDSSKFIRILESIKAITKEINSDVKLINNNVEHMKNDKTRAVNKRHSIKVLQHQIDENQQKMSDVQTVIDDITKKLEILYTSNQDYERTISKMESLDQDKKNMIKNIENLKLTTKLLGRPKEVLLDDLNNFANVLAEQMKTCTSLQTTIKDKSLKLTELHDSLNTIFKESGNLDSLFQQNRENISKRELLIEQFATELQITDISQFDSKLSTKLILLNQNYETKKSEFDGLISEISKTLMDAKLSHSKETQHLDYLTSDMKNLISKIEELQARHVSIAGNQTKIAVLKEDLKSKETAFQKIKSLNEISKLNQRIDSEVKSINLLEVELEDTQNKLQMNRMNNDVVSKLKVLNDMNKSASREVSLASTNIRKVLNIDGDIDEAVIVDQYNENIKSLEKRINKTRAELETKKFRRSKLKINYENNLNTEKLLSSKMLKLSSDFQALQSQYKNVYGDIINLDNYLELLNLVEDDYNDEFADFKDLQFLLAFNKRAIQSAEKKEMCYLCRRKFCTNEPHEREQLPAFIQLLKKRNLELSSKTDTEKSLERKEHILKCLRDFKSKSAELLNLKTKQIPEIQEALNKDQQIIFNFDVEIEAIDSDILKQKNEFNSMKNLEQDISIIKHQCNLIEERKDQINKLQDKLNEQGLVLISTEDLEKLNKELFIKLKNFRGSIESLKFDRDMKQKRNNELENDINQLKLSINELELKSMDKINIEKSIEETQIQVKEINKLTELSKSKIAAYSETVKKLTNDLAEQNKIRDNELKILNLEIEKYNSIKQQFSKIDSEMQSYKENQTEDKYNQCQLQIKDITAEIEKLNKSIEIDSSELKEIESSVSDSAYQERNIRSNLNLIQFEEDLQSIEYEINTLDTKQALAQRSQYLKKTSELQDSLKAYQRELATKLGETTQLEKQIKDIHDEITRDYKDIDKKYTAEYAKLQTKLAMATDLTTLYKATDNGVIEYHQTQMLKINNIIDELWKKTYTGNDVETIMIKADPIAAKRKNETSATNNRSYNYRVVMIKNGTELDMRGRCSAGQRVLASIIIRIALAECFCLNFGMIALDEPTTNLDDENIESLAKALHAIIQERSAQRNFQLIIITHDEKFIRCMNAVDFTDHYYKVMRDERLNSTINRVSIATVIE